jgi:N utilization substance protein B
VSAEERRLGSRTKARKRALDVLFEADQRGLPPLTVLGDRVAAGHPPISAYTVEIVEGVVGHAERIDELLSTYSQGWMLSRMPGVDRAILRVGTWELLWNDDVPDAVVIDEAADLAQLLSTDDSPDFVNGLLGRLLELKPSLA